MVATPISIKRQLAALAATTRALARNKDFDSSATWQEMDTLTRGEADHSALMERYHNPSLHHQLRPANTQAAAVFDALEAARVDALGGAVMRGVNRNVSAFATHRADTELPSLLALLLREQTLGTALTRTQKKALEPWRHKTDFSALSQSVDDQRRFADHVYTVLRELDLLTEPGSAHPLTSAPDGSQDTLPEQSPEESQAEAQTPTPGDKNNPTSEHAATPQSPPASAETMAEAPQFRRNSPPAGSQSVTEPPEYHAYNTAFDQTVPAETLATRPELDMLYRQLEQKLPALKSTASRLAARLQHLLLSRQARGWVYDQDDGILDARRLARVISTPWQSGFYKQAKDAPTRDTVVTLLIDNSGSMRGRPITIAALSADMLALTLERCGVRTEILGFTTREWKGGQTYKQWLKNGRPAQPGRLNDIRHIIYKSADTPWRKARKNLGLMLKEGILKENIDGEALLWAYNRLLARPERRRILMVISDGAPVDDTTLSSNGSTYLDRHLREAIARVERQGIVELMAIGIGHDVTRYYARAVTLSELERLPEIMTRELTKLFTEQPLKQPERSARRPVFS